MVEGDELAVQDVAEAAVITGQQDGGDGGLISSSGGSEVSRGVMVAH